MSEEDDTLREELSKNKGESRPISPALSNHSSKIKTLFIPLITAFAFLTQLPLARYARFDEEAIRKSIYFYPIAGLALGLVLVLAQMILPFTSLLNAAILLVLLVASTGALHLDGLADCTDAWYGGLGDKKRTLEIMKDSHTGAMASVSVSMLLIAKTAAIYQVLVDDQTVLLLLAPFIARTAVLGLFLSSPYIGTGPIGSALARADSGLLYLMLVASVVFCFLLVPSVSIALLLLFLLVLGWGLRSIFLNRLDGFTGDCAGAFIEVFELFTLVGGVLVFS